MIFECIYINSVKNNNVVAMDISSPLKNVGQAIAMKNCASDTKIEGGKGELKNKLGTYEKIPKFSKRALVNASSV